MFDPLQAPLTKHRIASTVEELEYTATAPRPSQRPQRRPVWVATHAITSLSCTARANVNVKLRGSVTGVLQGGTPCRRQRRLSLSDSGDIITIALRRKFAQAHPSSQPGSGNNSPFDSPLARQGRTAMVFSCSCLSSLMVGASRLATIPASPDDC